MGVATEMKMLRWIYDHTRNDNIQNDHIQKRVGVAPITEKSVENCLRWFGDIQRMSIDESMRRVDQKHLGVQSKEGEGQCELL